MTTVAKHFRIWMQMAGMSISAQLSHGLGSAGFLLGKLIRLLFFFAYIISIFKHTQNVAGYTLAETALFFLTFNLVDIIAMVFFRGIYSARRVVEEGDLDYYLIQPCSPLFRMAVSNVDVLDLLTMFPVLLLWALTWRSLPDGIGLLQIAAYTLLVANGIAIALAMHILVAALAVRTQELENTIWIYRDMMFLGKFPMDIYSLPLKWILTTIIPIGVMTSFPAKALLGILQPGWIAYAVALSAAVMLASLLFWSNALGRYTSVSS